MNHNEEEAGTSVYDVLSNILDSNESIQINVKGKDSKKFVAALSNVTKSAIETLYDSSTILSTIACAEEDLNGLDRAVHLLFSHEDGKFKLLEKGSIKNNLQRKYKKLEKSATT